MQVSGAMAFKSAATLIFGLCFYPAFGQITTEVSSGPVEAELLRPLNIRRLAAGASVFARVTRDWRGVNCSLRQGAILEATAESLAPHKFSGESHLALSFTKAQCDGADMKPMELLLSAVAQAPADWRYVPDVAFTTQVMVFDRNTGAGSSVNLRSNNFATPRLELKGIDHHFPMSSKVQPGDVIDIKGMRLELGTGPNRSSVLSTKGRDVSLEQFTQFLLVPSSLVFVRPDLPSDTRAGMASDGDISSAASHVAVPDPVNDLETCAPPGCALDLHVESVELEGKDAASIAISPLGYATRPSRNLGDLTEDEALAWLGPGQLLFAFNAHPLIHRGGLAKSKAPTRMIRAVLLDVQSRTVVRAVNWEVTDARRYLWALPDNRVLVHIGNELRVYGRGLNLEQTVALAGPLAFLRVSPNGKLVAMAELRERHSPKLHAQLQDGLDGEPEEDVDVMVLDEKFETVAKANTISTLEPPTLLNEGQVVLLAQPDNHYRLELRSWESKSTTLARFTSLCRPELSSMAPDLLFLRSCSAATDRTEYRVIRADGKLIMRSEAGPREIGGDVAGFQSSGTFALKAVHASRDLSRNMDFTGADLESEEVRVYQAADGKRVVTVRIDQPTTSHGGFALSPDGMQIAVLSGTEIRFFALPAQ
jgi:hypothetical protein